VEVPHHCRRQAPPRGALPRVGHAHRGRARDELARAEQIAEQLSRTARELGAQSIADARAQLTIPSDETVDEWFKRYDAHLVERGLSSLRDIRGHYKNHIAPILGSIEIRLVRRDHIEAVRDSLDRKIRDGYTDANGKQREVTWKTAANVWGTCTKMFDEAAHSKRRDLVVRADDPTDRVKGPDRGTEKQKPILYPSEVLALLSCERVPLYRRRVYAVAIYLGARANELAALTAADLDLDHGRVTIAKQVDRETGEDRQTKTRRARSFDIEPELLPLLHVLVSERPAGRLLHLPPDEDRAELLRKDLRTTGVERAELFVEEDEMRERLKFHNLRDTCRTWMAKRGDEPLRIQWRGGHTDFAMTQKYIAAGKNLGARFGQPFAPLPSAVLVAGLLAGLSASSKRQKPSHRIDERASVVTPTGLEPVLPA
jgi:integrase